MNRESPTLNEMLKLYSKKDLWERIQEKNQIIKQKDQQIAELKQQLETKNKNCLALYSALYETLAKENDENVASQIDFLTKQDNGEINDIYKELQVLKQQLAEKEKELNDWKDGTIICKLGELENRLAEKDKEYTRLHNELKLKCEYIREIVAIKDEYKQKLHTQPKEIVEKIIARMDNITDTLINLGNGKEDAVSWFLGILQEILKEYEEK